MPTPYTPKTRPPKRVLCIMDLSGVGRAGLSVVLPVLSACGVQACGLPAALFSTHTGGFGPVEKRDEAEFGEAALDHYSREGISFDAVYIGYLYGQAQFRLAGRALDLYPNAIHVVDPALGDAGKPYSGIGQDTIRAMQSLCRRAHLITPNFTESALLTGETPGLAPLGEEKLAKRLDKLCAGGRSALVTSTPTLAGGFETRGRSTSGDFVIPTRHVPQHYPGTGDTLTAATLGLLLRNHWPLEKSARRATSFVEEAVHATYQAAAEPRHGLFLEGRLGMLAEPEG